MLKRMTSLAIFAMLLLTGMCCTGMAAETDPDSCELKGGVMYIDLDKGLVIIAEKEVALLSHYEKKEKIWDTQFVDKEGRQITPDQIKRRDRVQMRGKSNAGKISAIEITLLESEKSR